MKQLKIIILSGLVSFFLLTGCQKQFTIEGGDPIIAGTNDSVYLDRITEVNYGVDDSTIQDFRYDNQKRVIAINKKRYQNNVLADTAVTTLFYSGSDSLPFKATYYSALLGVVAFFDSSTNFMSYDAQGRMILDSAIYAYGGPGIGYSREKDIITFQYTANNIYSYSTITDLLIPGPPTIQLDTTWLDANKNVVKRHYYDSQPLTLYRTEENTAFDNKRSPYFYMNIIPYFYLTTLSYTGMNNLLITHVEKLYIPSTYDESYVHTYNAFNMPTISVGTDIPTQVIVDKFYYKYRSL